MRYMKLMLVSGMNYVETFKTLRDILNIPPYQGMIERVLAGLQRWEKYMILWNTKQIWFCEMYLFW